MPKKSFLMWVLYTFLIFSMVIVSAQTIKMDISTLKETISPKENLTLKVSLLDENNALINDDIKIILEDSKKLSKIEKTIQPNKFIELSLGENPSGGYWKIIAQYNSQEAISFFTILEEELAKFELNGDELTITNIGNAEYHKQVQIIIGNTVGAKQTDLMIGGKITYRLIAPEGVYNIKISDGDTTITKSDVQLTGKAIGIIDERAERGVALTGGISPEEGNDLSLSLMKKGRMVYVFIAVILGAMILLAIERRYRKKAYG